MNAANKFSETGQYENAVALLNDRFEGDALENAVGSLNWYYAHHLMQKGDFDTAEAVMLEFGESNRISGLTSLAQTIFNKNPTENKNRAAGILRRVRSLLPDRPENYNETHQLSPVNGNVGIDAATHCHSSLYRIHQYAIQALRYSGSWRQLRQRRISDFRIAELRDQHRQLLQESRGTDLPYNRLDHLRGRNFASR